MFTNELTEAESQQRLSQLEKKLVSRHLAILNEAGLIPSANQEDR